MNRTEQFKTFLVFLIWYAGGLFILPDYGISWDEPLQRNHGLVSMDYVNNLSDGRLFEGKLAEHEWKDYPYKDHGVFFQLVCLGIEKSLDVHDIAGQYHIRHVIGFTLFVAGGFFLFLFFRKRWNSWNLALLGLVLYLSFPRIFADSFYNPKDTIALSWFCINLYTLNRFLEEKNIRSALIHGLLNAMMMNSRIFAVFVTAVTLGLLSLDQFKPLFRLSRKRFATLILVFLGSFVVFTILPWPNLWFDPFENLFQGLKRASRWHWEGSVLINGDWVKATELPRYYIPLWILITLPLAHLILFVSGLGALSIRIVRQWKNFGYRNSEERSDFMVWMLFVLPVAAILYKNSVMYDGWRHLFFLFACMVYFGLFAWKWLQSKLQHQKPLIRFVPVIILGSYLSLTAYQMIVNHPFQYVYFNELLKRPSTHRFETDYWGVSYKEAYKRLYREFPNDTFICVSRYDPAYYNYEALEPKYKERIKFIDERSDALPDHYYYISIFRFEYELNGFLEKKHPSTNPKLILYAYGNPVIGIFEVGKKNR